MLLASIASRRFLAASSVAMTAPARMAVAAFSTSAFAAAGAGAGSGSDAASGRVFDVTSEADFQQRVIDAKVPVIVDFWAAWCGPCRALTPTLTRVVGESSTEVHLAKVNVDEVGDIAAKYQISSIPAVFAFKNGAVSDQFVGALPYPKVKSFVDKLASQS
ncbi:thioredoxin [Capsaspora owczarzaki ATCC 30864]|nr:thioredoxin [Capsaspora owczarzaki ATCC 30864]|eukprot:XP_004349037.1 thioredoxin [Capsaspora owczarzaki ATCC 30864]